MKVQFIRKFMNYLWVSMPFEVKYEFTKTIFNAIKRHAFPWFFMGYNSSNDVLQSYVILPPLLYCVRYIAEWNPFFINVQCRQHTMRIWLHFGLAFTWNLRQMKTTHLRTLGGMDALSSLYQPWKIKLRRLCSIVKGRLLQLIDVLVFIGR